MVLPYAWCLPLQISYSLRLSACPLDSEEVQVNIFGSQSGHYSVIPEILHFTEDNWQEEQTIVLRVYQDDVAPSPVGHRTVFCTWHGLLGPCLTQAQKTCSDEWEWPALASRHAAARSAV